MIQQDEHIIYISQAKCAVTIKQIETMKTGMLEKKIVITTRRCLFFESLSNQVMEMEYEIMTKKKKTDDDKNKEKENQKKKRLSINQFPQRIICEDIVDSFPINDRQCKIMIDEEPSCHKYLQKIGLRNFIKSITGIVVLKNIPKMRFELLAFPTLKDGFRFCKAVVCSKAWLTYQSYCKSHNISPNKMFARILCDIATNEKSITLIDPDLFVTGNREQINAFKTLINQIPFTHTFQHRYSITSPEICEYCQDFLDTFQEKTYSLIFQYNNMEIMYLNSILNSRVKFEHIMHLDLSHNKLTDQLFVTLQKFTKQSKKLSRFILTHNLITLNNSTLFLNFLKSTQVMLTLNLAYNEIQDRCVEEIEKYVIMPSNPPIDELNLSYNKFSKKGAWRLFVGNMRYSKYHSYFNFIIYPIPITPDIFPQTPTEYPQPSPLINFNIHSALVQQFQQESFMKHTLNFILPNSSTYMLRLIRRLPKNIKLPRTKEEVYKATQMANRLENFIYSPQFVENMYDMAQEIMKFQFNIPPVSKARFIKYLSDKLNEALFIRDHYSVKFILKAFRVMQINFEGYEPRINKLVARNNIIGKKIEEIINFEIDEFDINHALDEIVREGLRLYLTGNGIQSIYFLKFLRDRWIEKLIQQKYNPEHFIHDKMADKNMNLDDQVTEKQLVIPYEIRVEKKINQNFYLHPWKTNYLLLTQILKVQFDQCLEFLEESSKKQKFAIYFERIQQRIQFMKNQFTLFNYNKFKSSYSDLKINCARLLSMYRFITQKNYFLQIPSIPRRIPITKQKVITVLNQDRFKKDYHIKFYPNINYRARKANFYNYTNKMTKYGSQMFYQEFLKLKILIDQMFKILEKEVLMNANRVPEEIMGKFVEIVKYIRAAIYPQELKEEFYLRVLSWRSGKFSNNKWILMYMPFLTMYLLPPLAMEKYIIAEILNCENLNIGELPMNMISDINKPTEINIQELQKNFVQRDWMGSERLLVQLMRDNGKMKIQIQLLVKKKLQHRTRESNTVGQIVSNLISQLKDIEDISHYWLYMGIVGDSSNLVVLEESQHLGEILCEKEEQEKYFLFKRRLYCPEWRYIYNKYSEAMVNNLYYDVRYEYLLGEFFINDKQMVNLAACMLIIDAVEQGAAKNNFTEIINHKLKNLGHIYKGYMPTKAINRYTRNTSQLVSTLKDKINEKLMKKDHLKTLQIKKQILKLFEDYPQFFCSNYLFLDRNKKLLKLSVNWLQIYVNSELQTQSIGLEKIISIIPKAKFLLINYHKHEGITGKVSLFGDQNKILSTAQDILAYCMIRIRMLSPSLYAAFRLEFLVSKHIKVKVPTKEKQILDHVRRIKKKLQSANPTIIQPQLIPYFSQNRYIKVFITRKLYANASLQKLDLVEDEQDDVSVQKIKMINKNMDNSRDVNGHNVFKTVFPQAKGQKMEDEENLQDFSMSLLGRSFSQPPELSAYNNISASNLQPPESQPTSKPAPSQEKDSDRDPPELTPIKENPPPNEQDFQPITTAQKPRSRLPPKRNR